MFGIGFRNRGPNPGIGEIDDGHNRLTGIEIFAFTGGTHRNSSGDWRIDLRIAKAHLSLFQLRFRIQKLPARGCNRALRGAGLMRICDGGIQFGLRGPNFCTVSACASGAHAIGEALRLLRAGDADVIIAGGSEATISPMAEKRYPSRGRCCDLP